MHALHTTQCDCVVTDTFIIYIVLPRSSCLSWSPSCTSSGMSSLLFDSGVILVKTSKLTKINLQSIGYAHSSAGRYVCFFFFVVETMDAQSSGSPAPPSQTSIIYFTDDCKQALKQPIEMVLECQKRTDCPPPLLTFENHGRTERNICDVTARKRGLLQPSRSTGLLYCAEGHSKKSVRVCTLVNKGWL